MVAPRSGKSATFLCRKPTGRRVASPLQPLFRRGIALLYYWIVSATGSSHLQLAHRPCGFFSQSHIRSTIFHERDSHSRGDSYTRCYCTNPLQSEATFTYFPLF